MVGQGLAVLVGAILGAVLTRTLAPETLDSWGWRIPFLFGLIIGPLGLYIRSNLDETDAFLQSSRDPASWPAALSVLTSRVKELLVCLGLVVSGTISFYVILTYIPTFARVQLHLPLDQAFLAQAIGLGCECVLIPIFGVVSDHIGRKPVLIAALVLDLAVTDPLFVWVSGNPSFGSPVDDADRALQPVWRFQRPDIDCIGGAVSDHRPFDLTCHRPQRCRHVVRRVRSVLRYLAHSGNRHADRAGVLPDVRRGGGIADGAVPDRAGT
jgi:MFS family permease